MINIADIVVFAIFLIFCIVGMARGFMKSLTKLLGSFLSLIIAMLLCNSVCVLICQTPLDEWMVRQFQGVYEGMGESMKVLVSAGNTDTIAASLSGIGVPGFIAKLLAGPMNSLIPEGLTPSVGLLLAGFTSQAILSLAVTIVLFVLIRLFVKMLNVFIHFVLKDYLLRVFDRILGLLFGAVKAFLLMCVLLTVGSYFITQSYASAVRTQLEEGKIAGIVYNHNIVLMLFEKYVNIDALFDSMFGWINASPENGQALLDARGDENKLNSECHENNCVEVSGTYYTLKFV